MVDIVIRSALDFLPVVKHPTEVIEPSTRRASHPCHAMEKNSTTDAAPLTCGEAWFDPIEAELRDRIRGFLEEMVEQEATAALGRRRYQRGASAGYQNGTRSRRLLGSFGPVEIAVPRARLSAAAGTSREWRSAVLPRYARMTRQVEALIASAYLVGTNTRRVKRALGALFKGAIGKDVVSRVWRKVKTDWEAWTRRDLAEEDIVRLVLDGSVVRVRLDRKATNISLLVVLGIRRDGQKVLLTVRNMGARAKPPGGACSVISSHVACGAPNS